MAPSVGNQNAAKSGVASWLKLGRLPPKSGHLRRVLNGLRDQIRAAVSADSGEITLFQELRIQTAIRHEARLRLLLQWSADPATADKLSIADRLAIMRDTGAAAESRDKAIRDLGIDRPRTASDAWAAIDAANRAPQPATTTKPATLPAEPPSAPASPTGDDSGSLAGDEQATSGVAAQ
jgi:hypothetical protein